MTDTLSRPLAARINLLPDPITDDYDPEIPPEVIEAAVRALAEGKTHYTDRPGILPLRQWLAEHLNTRFGLAMTPDAITITCGETEARFAAIKTLAKPGTTVFCPGSPENILGAVALAGAALTSVEIVNELVNPQNVSLVYLTPHDGQKIMDEVLNLTQSHSWYILWDMVYGREQHHPAQNVALAPRVVTVGGLSYRLPGWRVGWMAGSDMAGKLRAFKQSMTICSASVSQWAALGLVDHL